MIWGIPLYASKDLEHEGRSIQGHCVHARKSNRAFIGQSLSVMGCDKIFVHACTRPSNAPGWRLRACMHAKNREEGMKKSNRCAFLHIVVTVYRSHQDLPQTSTESGSLPALLHPAATATRASPRATCVGLLGATARRRAAEPPFLSHSHKLRPAASVACGPPHNSHVLTAALFRPLLRRCARLCRGGTCQSFTEAGLAPPLSPAAT
jgi:hypothetical protein